MKRTLLLTIATILAMSISAQKINPVGTWNEKGVDRTWIFNADGTKTLKGRQQLTYPLGGINCTFDMVQTRTDEKWTLDGKTLTMEAIPLNKLTIDVDYQKYGNYTAAQKQKINAAIPAFKQLAIKETRQGWQSFVGNKSTYTISSYNPKQMVLNLGGQEFVLERDLTKMTPAQKAAIEKEMQEYLSQENNKENKETTRQKPTQTTDDPDMFVVVEEKPQFPGGLSAMFKYLSNNIQYPTTAKENGVQGTVLVSVIVERDGSLSDVKVMKSLDPALDNEALRLVNSMPKWIPGKQNGVEVRVRYLIPISFKL